MRGITKEQGVCGGVACIQNTRMPVWTIWALWKHGAEVPEILDTYPQLTNEQVIDALEYAKQNQAEITQDWWTNTFQDLAADYQDFMKLVEMTESRDNVVSVENQVQSERETLVKLKMAATDYLNEVPGSRRKLLEVLDEVECFLKGPPC